MYSYLPPGYEVCVVSHLYPFMIVASGDSALSVIYYLLRQVPFLINQS